ncbi:MAG: DUF3786 domain-containing protein [Desulfobacter sp.]|nr:MAG: DUF3786 domain-containing protein [Desulfobacter sp.]
MSLVSPVFEQHYKEYLRQVGGMDFKALAPLTGGRVVAGPEGQEIEIQYFNRPCRISASGIVDGDGRKAEYDTCAILCRYLIMARDRSAEGPGPREKKDWTGFRDLKDSGPLTVYFRDNVEMVISQALAGRLPLGPEAFRSLNAAVPGISLNYDLALEINALPKMPMLVLANGAEEGFPATCSVLFRPDVERILDAECIAMVGYRLARLIRSQLI